MLRKTFAAAFLLAAAASAAEQPLPELRIEPTGGGTFFIIRNLSAQPLTAFLVELVDYPGSSYALWQDEIAAEPIAPGAERRMRVANMTVGAAPGYVKMRAALYADGTSSGIPEKVTQLVERRRYTLQITRELIGRLEKAQSKAALAADLKQWAESIPAPTRANRTSQIGINQAAAQTLIADTAAQMEAHSVEETLNTLRASERALAASKPAL
jgi:galactitol-specific phosphotransferase system IIB component